MAKMERAVRWGMGTGMPHLAQLFHLVFGDAFVVLREQVAGVFEISLTLALF